jgi:hypothetical protein
VLVVFWITGLRIGLRREKRKQTLVSEEDCYAELAN